MSSVASSPNPLTNRPLACPCCRKRYRIPRSLMGKIVQCSDCGTKMKVKTPAKNTALAQVPAIPGLKTAGTGFLLSAAGGIIVVVLMAAVLFFSLTQFNFATRKMVGIALMFGLAIAALSSIAGLIMQMAVPQQATARRWLVASIAIGLLPIGILIYPMVTGSIPKVAPWIMNATLLVLSTISFLCYTKFAAIVAKFSDRPELASTAKFLAGYHVLGPVLISAFSIAIPLMVKNFETVSLWSNLTGIVGMIATVVTNVVLIVLMCQLGTHLRKR